MTEISIAKYIEKRTHNTKSFDCNVLQESKESKKFNTDYDKLSEKFKYKNVFAFELVPWI